MTDSESSPVRASLEHEIRAILFDIDGTLLTTGGAGASAWSQACEKLHGSPVDIERITESGMTDSAVARAALQEVLGRDPAPVELDALTASYLDFLPEAVATPPPTTSYPPGSCRCWSGWATKASPWV